LTKYIADIGLEVHVELSTKSKMFCSCKVVDNTEAKPNIAVCPVCCGMPGTLPIINKKAVEFAIRAAAALECKIARTSIFARKNYFYPDLPKGYQISQYEHPLAEHGRLIIHTKEGPKTIHIHRAHLEEDTGKLTHVNNEGQAYSLVNLNRAGVPLLEIVSKPDMHNVTEVAAYSKELRLLLRTIGVTSGDMEKGTMRFEANLSMRPADCKKLGTRVEVKNLNSFRAMENAIQYQMRIQQKTLQSGKPVKQQTLGWDENAGKTFSQRSKENANDYRYFPEPDLPPLIISDNWITRVKEAMVELPNEKRERYRQAFDLQPEETERLVEDKAIADFFEKCIETSPTLSARAIANWLFTDLFAWINLNQIPLTKIKMSAKDFTDLISTVQQGIINQNTGKEVLRDMLASGKSVYEIVKEKGLQQLSDTDQIALLIDRVLKKHQSEVTAYLNGKDSIFNWLFGQVMRAAKGKANPQIIKQLLQDKLNLRQ